MIWFNPPFSKTASTNVAKTFLHVVTQNFPRSHKLQNIFNCNTVNVSYSCMNNMLKIIKGHNKKVTAKSRDQTPKCNCKKIRMSNETELSSQWCSLQMLCNKTINKKVYLGLTGEKWKLHVALGKSF